MSDIRPGEIAFTLPDKFDAGVYFIGRMRTPWKTRAECPKKRPRFGRRMHRRTRAALCSRARRHRAMHASGAALFHA